MDRDQFGGLAHGECSHASLEPLLTDQLNNLEGISRNYTLED